MLESDPQLKSRSSRIGQSRLKKSRSSKSKRRTSMGKTSLDIISELYNPIDAINRFINLALHSLEEGSPSRQFLVESKKGIRKTSNLLKRLNNCVKRIEKETQ